MGKRKDRSIRLAHFSDLHIEDEEGVDVAVESVRHALRRGADHVAITGDITESASTELTKAFLNGLGRIGLRSPEKLSVVPGNHDWLAKAIQQPTAAHQRFCRAVKRLAQEPLFANAVFPYGKRLSPGVVLVGLDTTIESAWLPPRWTEGELDEEDLDAAAEFFEEHEDAEHRIVLMHHYPFNTPPVLGMDMDFNDPDAATARNWLEWAGATLVLCGHVHDDHDRTTKGGVRVLCNGGGYPDSGYYLIDLKPNGKVSVEIVGL